MSDWDDGYVSDIGYTYGYYRELNPLRVKLAFLNAGLVAPEFGNACELGFGQGVSAVMHAAASVCTWHGTDFNPSQAGFAQELAAASGASAHLYDQSFEEFVTRPNLPEFDYIGLHGIWSWISDENRQVIVNFIRTKLKVGGVLYISYNTLPGWSNFAPMRHLMTQHASVMGAQGFGIVQKIDNALTFASDLLATTPMFARANPSVNERFKQIQTQHKHYLAHEYFNKDWHPMYFASMAEYLEQAKLTFACSAHYLDHIEVLNLTKDQQSFLASIENANLKQSMLDFMVNQTFRRDYWVKGPRKLNAFERVEALRKQSFVLAQDISDVPLKVTGLLGEANLTPHIYEPILKFLSDHKVRSLGEIEAILKDSGINFTHLNQAIMVLAGCGHLYPVQEKNSVFAAKKSTDRFNERLLQRAINDNEISQLASPLIGGGVPVGRFQQLFLLSIKEGKKTPQEWANFVFGILMKQGEKIVKDGKLLETEAENLEELNSLAKEFSEKRIPIMKALSIL